MSAGGQPNSFILWIFDAVNLCVRATLSYAVDYKQLDGVFGLRGVRDVMSNFDQSIFVFYALGEKIKDFNVQRRGMCVLVMSALQRNS